MSGINKKSLWVGLCLVVLISVAGIGIFFLNQKKPGIVIDQSVSFPETFHFFELGANTNLNLSIRNKLEEELGSEAMQTWGYLDIPKLQKEFIQNHFPAFDQLLGFFYPDSTINTVNDIIHLTYRYATKKKQPFYYVRLSFSKFNNKPLFFQIQSTKDAAYLLDVLLQKYGKPIINQEVVKQATLSAWEFNQDILILTRVPNRFAEIEFHVTICYTNNMQQCINKLQQQLILNKKQIQDAASKAF
ncbi:MAG: hypothetical protein HQK77_06665 [Desulfobacterales bacterium]|nr:hypothetical protein [Desulfobacterales bacterium]